MSARAARMLTRRSILAAGLGAATLAASGLRPGRAEDTLPALRGLARAKGIDLGSAFSGHGNAKYRDLVARHCEVLTPEWQLKPRFLRPSAGASYNFGESDGIAAFCRENGQKFHGHTLFWHQEPIRWAESDDFETVKERYGGYIKDVIAHYPQAVSWDVFNEIVEEKTRFRNEFLIRKFGFQFIDFCFRTAHEAGPDARLVINDYNLECAGAWCRSKQDNMLAVVKKLKTMGTPVHVVGIQGHLSSKYPASAKSTLAFIRRVADLGCDVYLSETT